MESTSPPRPGGLRSIWLPLLISLSFHAGLVLLLYLIPASVLEVDQSGLPVNTLMMASDDSVCTLRILGRPQVQETPYFPISVIDPTVNTEPSRHQPNDRAIDRGVSNSVTSPQGNATSGETTQPGAGGATGPSIFQVSGQGKSVVYAIDRSLSMGIRRTLPAAKRELLASLKQLPETVRFQVILYNQQAEPLRLEGRTDLVAATSKNKQQVAELVEAIRAAGPTDHLAALRRALLLQPEVVFFITDAADLNRQQIQAVTQQNHGRSAIHAIELSQLPGDASEDGPLAQLARANRGTYRRVWVKGE